MISISQIQQYFTDCKYKYFLARIEKVKVEEKESKYLFIGKEVHRIISEYYKQRTEIKRDKKSMHLWMIKITKDLKYKEDIRHSLNGFIEFELENVYDSVICETEFKFEELHGVIDAIFIKGTEITLIDWKTSNKEDIDLSSMLQLRMYQYLYNKVNPNTPVSKIGMIFVKTRTPIMQDPYPDNDKFINDMVEDFKKSIESKDFAKTGNFCMYCDYLELCGGR